MFKTTVFFLFVLFSPLLIQAEDLVARTGHTTATLIAEKTGIAPGVPFFVGLYLNTEAGWHTYANPPGESGLPTEIEWELPQGFSAGPILWPKPHTFNESGIVAYGYEGPVLLPILITPPTNIVPGKSFTFYAKVHWLECKALCLPGSAAISLTLPVLIPAEIKNTAHRLLFDQALSKEPSPADSPKSAFSLALIFGWAFAGGLILNLMPCVFPVLGLKVMGFVAHAHESKSKIRIQGLVFTLGVLLSFWALSGLLLLLRAQGEALGWGFQLQSPGFVLFLITLLFALGLVFLGVFEVGLGLAGAGASLATKEGVWGSFFSGILATLVATPCTAPFMGVALGFALSQPAWMALCVFTALALGMASPYLLLSFSPALLKFLPRPGAWMESFKEAMAFPLFGTTAWLIWVFGLQTQMGAVAEVLFGLTLIGLLGWAYGRWASISRPTLTRRIALFFCSLLAAGALALFIDAARAPQNGKPLPESHAGLTWEPYSLERLSALRAEHRPIFIDFTAAWCLTCQANLRGVLSDERVAQAFRDKDITPLMADWTRRDPIVTEALAAVGRSGVPTYALYPADPSKKPLLLPEVLTVDIVLEAINNL